MDKYSTRVPGLSTKSEAKLNVTVFTLDTCVRRSSTVLARQWCEHSLYIGTHASIIFLYAKTKVEPDGSEVIAVLLPVTINCAHRFKMASV